jgi:magnesium-transporting ATPase (P-type)
MIKKQQEDISKKAVKTGLLVTGSMLDTIMADESSDLFAAFSQLALKSDVVLCCRVSPKQKQEIVAMVKKAVKSRLSETKCGHFGHRRWSQ